MSDPTLFISAGEASGEAYGAMLIAALQKRFEARRLRSRFVGMGGQRMVDAGLERVVRAEDMAVMGITEVVRHLPRIYREFRRLKSSIRQHRPALAILIDFPDIHFKLAEEFHRLGIPVVFFVSPQLWAWKKHRIKLVQRFVDRMLVIFPFEEQFYRDRGVNAEFVGHPLADLALPTVSRQQFADENQLDSKKMWIALLPGSRAKEIDDNLPEMIEAARLLHSDQLEQRNPEPQFILPLATTLTTAQRNTVESLVNRLVGNLTIRLISDQRAEGVSGRTAGALFHSRAAVVASGTATVEAALIGNPFVVVYRVSPITYAIAKRVVSVPHVAMANLIAGKRVVPELIQHDFTASNIVRELQPLLPDGPPRQSMMQELQRVRALLIPPRGALGAIDRVADIALGMLSLASPVTESVPS
ncbi:MAG TPA: lipid-A-disaccharide synthase [Terracidiphilus sp.]|jgi:lipid-A-disaccharide synthase|nr:lipid-A-disaccharide synthase [Terracidiphilus sp.]